MLNGLFIKIKNNAILILVAISFFLYSMLEPKTKLPIIPARTTDGEKLVRNIKKIITNIVNIFAPFFDILVLAKIIDTASITYDTCIPETAII